MMNGWGGRAGVCSSWVVVVCLVAGIARAAPQAEMGSSLSGVVRNDRGALLNDIFVIIEDTSTGRQWSTLTSPYGVFEVRVPPGMYRVRVDVDPYEPFKTFVVVVPEHPVFVAIVLTLRVYRGDTSDNVVVQGDAPSIGTFPHSLIERLPLTNGRTLHSLMNLVPGVVSTEAVPGSQAQFTAGGSRRTMHRTTVDGAQVEFGLTLDPYSEGQKASASTPTYATLGTTQTVVPLIAVDVMRVRTIDATTEERRSPGAQTSIVTVSGADQFRASALADLRPNALAARDYFDYVPNAPVRETRSSNRGAAFGGPIWPQHLYYSFAWEDQNVQRPVFTTIRTPSVAAREAASPVVRSILDLFPLPNRPEVGPGLAEYAGEFPVDAKVSVWSLRLDARFRHHHIMTRFQRGVSQGDEWDPQLRLPRRTFNSTERTRTVMTTIGVTSVLSSSVVNEWTGHVGYHRASTTATLAHGGTVPYAALVAPDIDPATTLIRVQPFVGLGPIHVGETGAGAQQQIQITDTVTVARGRHHLRAGVDFRRVTTASTPAPYRYAYRPNNLAEFLAGRVRQATIEVLAPVRARRDTWSLFAQDTMRLNDRFSVTAGLRWSVLPAPWSLTDRSPALHAYDPLPDLQPLPQGSRLWRTSWTDFAPRLGAVYQLRREPGREINVRAGWGIVVDEISNPGAQAFGRGSSYISRKVMGVTAFPLSPDERTLPLPTAPVTADEGFAFPRDFRAGKSREWWLGLDQTFGTHRLDLAVVGANGYDLSYWHQYQYIAEGLRIDAYGNDATSKYLGLLCSYSGRVSKWLEMQTAYTWSRSTDTDSGESLTPNVPPQYLPTEANRGLSDFDRPHVLHARVSAQLPSPRLPTAIRGVLSNWKLDGIVIAQSGSPIDVTVARNFSFGTHTVRPDLVPSVPLWIEDHSVPGGRRANRDAFRVPEERRQGTTRRNMLRSSPVRQIDLGLSRSFRCGRITAQIRVDAHNVFNLPNFGRPLGDLSNPDFGVPTRPYADALGSGTLTYGGLVSLQQVGGSRSFQVGIRVGM